MQNPFESAMTQLDAICKLEKFKKICITDLHEPDRIVKVSIPVEMDDGSTRNFEGFRVEYNNALGPYKGGIRFHQDTDIDEVKALAFWMTIKCSLAGIPMGGGKGGITLNPKELSKGELERLSRGFARELADVIGPYKDVPAPDVNTTPEIMAWIADEYGKITGDTSGAVITGKPLDKGGSEGRNTATAQGAFYTFEAFKKELNLPEKCNVVIQGFGNAGQYAGSIWSQAGHKIIAISDSRGGIYNPDGLDIKKLVEHKKSNGSLSDFPGTKDVSNSELLELECDLLIPAALEHQITKDNASKLKTKAVLEIANGPTTPEADALLKERNIPVVPDVLANSGGVIVSYFEWDQNLKKEHWSEKEVFEKLYKLIETSSKKVIAKSKELNSSYRTAAFVVALERISEKGYKK